MYLPIEHIAGMVPTIAGRLKDIGIYDLDELLEVAGTELAMTVLAQELQLGLPAALLLWHRAVALKTHLRAIQRLTQAGRLIFLEEEAPESDFSVEEPAALYGVGIRCRSA